MAVNNNVTDDNELNRQEHSIKKIVEQYPEMNALALEHLRYCFACNQRSIQHYLGAEQVTDDVRLRQIFESSEAILLHVENRLEKMPIEVGEPYYLVKRIDVAKYTKFYKIGAGVVMLVIGGFGTFIGYLL